MGKADPSRGAMNTSSYIQVKPEDQLKKFGNMCLSLQH